MFLAFQTSSTVPKPHFKNGFLYSFSPYIPLYLDHREAPDLRNTPDNSHVFLSRVPKPLAKDFVSASCSIFTVSAPLIPFAAGHVDISLLPIIRIKLSFKPRAKQYKTLRKPNESTKTEKQLN